jgi:hypothetical protein
MLIMIGSIVQHNNIVQLYYIYYKIQHNRNILIPYLKQAFYVLVQKVHHVFMEDISYLPLNQIALR